MTARIRPPLLEIAAAEARLAHEFWLIAAEVAFQRHLMHRVTGRSTAEVLLWYFDEYPNMKKFFETHVAAGTCNQGVTELQNDRKKHRPKLPSVSPRGSGFEWANNFRAPPIEIPDRIMPEPATSQKLGGRPRRGPRPAKFQSVSAAMRKHGLAEVADMKQVVMQATFQASRDTCKRVLDALLAEEALSKKQLRQSPAIDN